MLVLKLNMSFETIYDMLVAAIIFATELFDTAWKRALALLPNRKNPRDEIIQKQSDLIDALKNRIEYTDQFLAKREERIKELELELENKN